MPGSSIGDKVMIVVLSEASTDAITLNARETNHVTEAARLLEISRDTLYKKIKKYHIVSV